MGRTKFERIEAGGPDTVVFRVSGKLGFHENQKVERLAQLNATRVRTLVSGTHLSRARKHAMHAREDVKINGEKIHIG